MQRGRRREEGIQWLAFSTSREVSQLKDATHLLEEQLAVVERLDGLDSCAQDREGVCENRGEGTSAQVRGPSPPRRVEIHAPRARVLSLICSSSEWRACSPCSSVDWAAWTGLVSAKASWAMWSVCSVLGRQGQPLVRSQATQGVHHAPFRRRS